MTDATMTAVAVEQDPKPPADRGKLDIKWFRPTDGSGIRPGCVIAGANQHDSPLLRPALEKLARFRFNLPDQMRLHLDAGYDSNVTRDLLDELGFDGHIQPKGVAYRSTTPRWAVKRTNSWNTRGFNTVLACTERRAIVIEAFLARMMVMAPSATCSSRAPNGGP